MRYSDAKGPGNPLAEGDRTFSAMNLKADRTALEPGMYAEAMNKRTTRGVAETRPGTLTPVWANVYPFPAILGSGVYSNPNGDEVILVATPNEVVQIRCGAFPTSVAIPAGVTLTGTVNFSQQFDKVLLHQSDGGQTYVWDGVSVAGFVAAAVSNPALDPSFLTVTPNLPWSINLAGRAIYPLGRDQVIASNILDYTSYDPILGVFRANAGTADPIVGLYPYTQSNVVVGKRRSIDVLRNFTGDLSTASMQIVSDQIGIVARRSAQMMGADILFLSDTGVYRMSQVVQSLIQTQPTPVSDPIEPLIRRINFAAAENAVAAVLGFYYFLAVPIDGSTVNNAVLVYNTVKDGWEAWDTWNPGGGFQIDNLLVSNFQSSRRVYAINHGAKKVHVLYEGLEDELPNGIFPISDLFRSRAYPSLPTLSYRFDYRGVEEFSPNEFITPMKDFKQIILGLRTWNPSVTVTAVGEGAANTRLLTLNPIGKSRTQYYSFGRPDYDPTNVNDDFQTPGRQDYSVAPPAGGVFPGSNGIVPDLKQERPEIFSVKVRSRWMAVDIANSQGTCDVLGILTESSGVRDQRRRGA